MNITEASPKAEIISTREEMLERIIEEQFDSMDHKALYWFFHYYTQREYNDISTEDIEDEYKNLFDDEK